MGCFSFYKPIHFSKLDKHASFNLPDFGQTHIIFHICAIHLNLRSSYGKEAYAFHILQIGYA